MKEDGPQRVTVPSKARTLFVNGYATTHFNYIWHFGPEVLDSVPELELTHMSAVSLSHHRTLQNLFNYFRFIRKILHLGPRYDYLFCHENTYSSRLIAALKKLGFLHKPKLVLLEFDIDIARGSRLRRYSVEWFMRLFYTSADLILASSHYQKETYRQAQMFETTRIDYIPSSLSDNRVAFLEAKAAAAPTAPVAGDYIFSVGQSNRDFTSLLKVADEFPDRTFVIMARQAAHAPPANVSFVDWGSYEDYMRYLVNAQLVLVPLKNHQHAAGLTTLFETWAAGKPVMIAATSAIKEFAQAKDGTAFMYQPENAADLAATLRRALEDPAVLSAVATNGKTCLHKKFTSRAYLTRLRAKLKELEA